MQVLSDHYGVDRFARHLGMEILEVSPGKAKVAMKVQDFHLNGLGTLHGGAIFALADFAFGIACNTSKVVTVAINANISYLRAVKEGTLIAEAEEVGLSPRLGTYHISVKDDNNEIIAVFQGLGYRKSRTNNEQ